MSRSSKNASASSFLPPAIVAGELAVLFVGATMPSPLYPLYARRFGFGEITLTLVYAAYVLGNLAALLLLGRLSDQIGRRRATLPALGLAIASTIAFLIMAGTASLFAGRILSGVATGLGAGAMTAWLAELPGNSTLRSASIATAANFLGTATGPLLSGILATFVPAPLIVPSPEAVP